MDRQRGFPIHNHVELPGGRHVEVIYLDGVAQRATSRMPALPPTPATAAGLARQPLHVCAACGGGLVHPLDWTEKTPEHWLIVMRCPDCGDIREGVFGRSQVELLDDELDRACGTMLSDLRLLTHANMSEEVEIFARALELDLIGAEDFRPQR